MDFFLIIQDRSYGLDFIRGNLVSYHHLVHSYVNILLDLHNLLSTEIDFILLTMGHPYIYCVTPLQRSEMNTRRESQLLLHFLFMWTPTLIN